MQAALIEPCLSFSCYSLFIAGLFADLVKLMHEILYEVTEFHIVSCFDLKRHLLKPCFASSARSANVVLFKFSASAVLVR